MPTFASFYRVGWLVSFKPYMKKVSFQNSSVLFSPKIASLQRPITLLAHTLPTRYLYILKAETLL